MKTACNSDKAMSSNQPHSDDAKNPRKPNHDAQGLLRRQMQQVVLLYGSGKSHPSLQRIADELALNPIKVRKLLITAGVYRSDIAARVNERFSAYEREGMPHKDAIAFTARDMQLSTSSVASYLPYSKCLYFPAETAADNLSTGAERQRRYIAVQRLRENPTEKTLWNCVVAFRNYPFTTLSGLPFAYDLKMGRHGKFIKELWITRRENSKSLTWSSVLLAFRNIEKIGAEVERPKALGDIRGVSYIYALFCRFGLIRAPHGTT